MALGDWDRYASSPTKQISIDVTSPIVANGSLHLIDNGGTVGGANLVLKPTFSSGFSAGRIQTLVRVTDFIAASNLNSGPVLLAMQSTKNFVTAGNGYICQFGNQANGTNALAGFGLTVYISLTNQGIGVAGTGYLAVSSSPVFLYALGDVYAIEYQWELNLQRYGGIRHITRMGPANVTSFASMVLQTDVIQTTNLQTTTVAEGVGYWKGNATGGTGIFQRCNLDETGILVI
jgi:hypothetical protein